MDIVTNMEKSRAVLSDCRALPNIGFRQGAKIRDVTGKAKQGVGFSLVRGEAKMCTIALVVTHIS